MIDVGPRIPGAFSFLPQPLIDLDDAAWFGLSSHVADLDPFDDLFQNLRGQFLDVGVLADGGIDLSAFHAPGEGAYLAQDVGIEHIVVDPVGPGTFVGAFVMVRTEVDIRNPILQFLPADGHGVAAAFAEQQPTEQILPLAIGGAAMARPDLLDPVEHVPGDDGLVGVGGHHLPLRRHADAFLGLKIDHFRFQVDQVPGVYPVVQDPVDSPRAPRVWRILLHRAKPGESVIPMVEFVIRRRDIALGFQPLCDGYLAQILQRQRKYPPDRLSSLRIDDQIRAVISLTVTKRRLGGGEKALL